MMRLFNWLFIPAVHPSKSLPDKDELRNIIATTIWARSAVGGNQICWPMRISVECISKKLADMAPAFTSTAALIDWLEREIYREEFSLCEDVLDGSAS